MTILPGIDLRPGRWQEALKDVGEVDALVSDPPYSERTHRANEVVSELKGHHAIDYAPLAEADVAELVEAWAPRVRGWWAILTDHILVPVFTAALEGAGRYVFSPLACVDPGSRVRLAGDGPSQWSVWLVVARPRTREWATWGTLPGAYVRRSPHERPLICGGKPGWLMRDIIQDYTRPGDLVVDPYAGAGTTLLAAHRLGRRAVGAEMDPETFELARGRLEREGRQGMLPGLEAA